MKTKRITCAILCVIMVAVLLPATAFAAGHTGIWVGDVEVAVDEYYLNDGNGGIRADGNASETNYNVHFYIDDEGANVLTLKGASITRNHEDDTFNLTAAIYTESALTINLIGSNTLSGAGGDRSSVGIFGRDTLTIVGNGSLTVNCGATSDASYGVFGYGITVADHCLVKATGGDTTTGTSYGVYGANLTISDHGTVTATGGEVINGASYGVYGGNLTISDHGTVTATGGDVTTGTSYGVNGVNLTISDDCTVTATGGDVATGVSCGVYGYGVTISDHGTVTATGGETSGKNCKSNGVYGNNFVNITGGRVNATGSAAKDEAGGYSNGVYGDIVRITDATVEATGGEVINGASYGVYGNETVGDSVSITRSTVDAAGGKVSGSTLSISCGLFGNSRVIIQDSTVTAIGNNTSTGHSYGVYGGNSVTMLDSTVEASAGKASRWSCGVNGYNSITIAGGKVTAAGGASGSDNSYGLNAPRTEEVATIFIPGGTVDAAGATAGVRAGHTFVTGGTLTAHGDHALACTIDTLDDCLVVGPAGQDRGFICRVSDAARETDWSVIAPYDAVFGATHANFSCNSVYFSEHSVRISEVSAVSGIVTDAAGHPVDGFSLYVDGFAIQSYNSEIGSGAYTIYVENGTHTVSAEKGTQIGSINVSVDRAALSEKDIRMGIASIPGITVTPAAAFTLGGAPDHLTLLAGNTGGTPNRAAHFGSLEISSDNANFTTVDSENYSLRYGSIHIELSKGWLNSLAPGTYTLRVNFAGAYAGLSQTTKLTVANVPETGDGNTPLLWLGLVLLCGTGLLALGRVKRRAEKRK